MRPEEFYLGMGHPGMLEHNHGVSLMISHNRLQDRVSLPYAWDDWMLDSGAFTLLQRLGRFPFTPEQYVRKVERYRLEIGRMKYAAPMDLMCEPAIIHGGTFKGVRFAGTGLTKLDHLRLTVANYKFLTERAPYIPWLLVLQGDTKEDYRRCYDMYEAVGVDFSKVPRVGLGSICRREATDEIGELVEEFSFLPLHGFGVKIAGLRKYGHLLTSADSQAWSYHARHKKVPLCGHPGHNETCREGCRRHHKNCANCLPFALMWRDKVLAGLTKELEAAA